MSTDYIKLARDLECTANHVQFVEVLKGMLKLEYTKGFNEGYKLAKDIDKQTWLKHCRR